MTRNLGRWTRHRALIGYLILTVGVLGGFVTAASDRVAARRQVCEALREDRLLFRDVIDVAIPPQTARQPALDPALDPALRRLITESRTKSTEVRRKIGQRLARPIDLCRSTGIDPTVRLSALGWR